MKTSSRADWNSGRELGQLEGVRFDQGSHRLQGEALGGAGQDRTQHRAQPADDGVGQVADGREGRVLVGVGAFDEGAEQHAGGGGHGARQYEGHDPVVHGIDPQGGGRGGGVAHRQQGPARLPPPDAQSGAEARDDDHAHEQEEQALVAEVDGEDPRPGDHLDPLVLHRDEDQELGRQVERQGGHGEIQAREPEGGQAGEEAGRYRGHHGQGYPGREGDAFPGQEGGHEGPEADEAGLAQGDGSRPTGEHGQGQGDQGVDGDEAADEGPELGDQVRVGDEGDQEGEPGDEDPDRALEGQPGPFRPALLPPLGPGGADRLGPRRAAPPAPSLLGRASLVGLGFPRHGPPPRASSSGAGGRRGGRRSRCSGRARRRRSGSTAAPPPRAGDRR